MDEIRRGPDYWRQRLQFLAFSATAKEDRAATP